MTNNENRNKQSLFLPISIIVAGLFLGGGIFAAALVVSGSGNQQAQQGVTDPVIAPLTYESVSPEDHIRGDLEAPVKLIDYSDLECPFCKRHHGTLLNLMASYQNDQVAWVYRHFPLEKLHAKAIPEAVAAECVANLAGGEAFWSFIDTIYEETPSNDGLELANLPQYAEAAGVTDLAAFQACYDNGDTLPEVEADLADAGNAGGTGTPYSLITSETEINRRARNDIFKTMQGIDAAEFVTFSEGGHAVGVSGALPQEILGAIIDRLLELNS